MTRREPSDRFPAALTATAVAAWWILVLAVLGAGVPHPLDDTWEYGVVARALIEGDGFRTQVVHPPLWTLRDAAMTVPVLVHGPLPPLLLVPALAIAGPAALDHVAWLGALGAVLAAAAMVRFAARRGRASDGVLAAIAYTLAPLTLRSVTHDVTLTLGAALLVVATDLALRERPRAFAAGLVLGVAWLLRAEMLAAALVLAVATRALAPALAGGFLLPAAPWIAHHALAVGQPLFNLSNYLLIGYWGERPGLSVLRDFALTPARWPDVLRAEFAGLPAKWIDFLPHALKRLAMAPTGATGWLAAVGVLGAWGDRRAAGAARVLPLLALVPVAIMTATLYDERYLAPFLPLACIAVAWGLRTLATWLPRWADRTRFRAGLLVLLLAPSALPAVREAPRLAREDAVALADARARLERVRVPDADATWFSDRPDFVAWTTGRATVWVTREEWQRLPERAEPGSAVPARGDSAATFFLDPPRPAPGGTR